ncbi:MAG: VTT domain-containing protein [Nitrospira sp.]|jgi:membrane protein DedA with SNARE-associated domain/rhodanese-related sulfurtransferase|nr:VTT domain-containing protein [Nitrospira sp.]
MESLGELLQQEGAWVLFGGVLAEQLGLPFPALPLLIAAGVLVGTGHLSWSGALMAALSATLLADLVWFLAGRWRGRPVLTLLCRIALEPDACVRRTEDFFRRHGVQSLLVAKFIPGLSTIAPPLAGIVGLGLPLFLLYDALGALVWAASGLGFGLLFSEEVEHALAYSEQAVPALLLTAVIVLPAYVGWKAWHVRRQLRRVPRMTVTELLDKLATPEPPLLIDVRPRLAIETEPGIPNALHIALEDLAHKYAELPRSRDLVLYCACPADAASAQGVMLLQRKGFSRAWPLAGGLHAWRAIVEEPEPVPMIQVERLAI